MGKYNLFGKDEPNPLSDHKRFCRVCKRQSYLWVCCGKRTSRVNLDGTIRVGVACKFEGTNNCPCEMEPICGLKKLTPKVNAVNSLKPHGW
jgi:hypothetical protein